MDPQLQAGAIEIAVSVERRIAVQGASVHGLHIFTSKTSSLGMYSYGHA